MDTTSRLLVFEAIKTWRKNRTTIVITHDLNPILPTDFVYVIKDGNVVEQGYRADLDEANGWFNQMAALQAGKSNEKEAPEALKDTAHDEGDFTKSQSLARRSARFTAEPGAMGVMGTSLRSLMSRSTYFDQQDLDYSDYPGYPGGSRGAELFNDIFFPPTRSSSREGMAATTFEDSTEEGRNSKRYSDFAMLSLEHAARSASGKRTGVHRRHVSEKRDEVADTIVEMESEESKTAQDGPRPGFFKIMRRLIPAVPDKWLMTLGYFFCIVSGVSTPIFSVLMSNMITILGTGAGLHQLLRTALLVLLVAACDGVGMWMKYSLLQRTAMNWVADLRERTFHQMLSQDKTWFDHPENSPMRLSIINVADVEDARNVIGMIAGQFVLVTVMLLLGLIWAMVVGWELTLIGLSIAPVMLLVLVWQTTYLGKREQKNKLLREDAANQFHQVR